MSDPKVEEAKQLADLGQFQEALALLQSALRDNPQDLDIQNLLEDVQLRMQLEEQVQEKLSTVQTLIDEGQGEQAKKILQEILRVSPGHPEATILLRGLSTATPVITDTYPGLPVQETPTPLQEPGGSAKAAGEPDAFEMPEPLEPEPNLSPRFDAISLSADTPGESSTDQSANLMPLGSQLGDDEIAKVQEYVKEGQAHFDAGRYQEAIDAWTRVYIIDENNQDVQALIESAKENLTQHQAQIEHYLTDGIAAFHAADFQRCRELMQQILAVFPGHREAQHYLDRAADEEEKRDTKGGSQVAKAAALAREEAERKAAARAVEEAAAQEAAQAAAAQEEARKAAAQAEQAHAQALEQPGTPAPSKSGMDDFELEDDLTASTGPEMRSNQTAGAEFQFDSGGDEMSFASINPAAPGATGGAPADFTLEEGPAPPQAAAPAPAPVSTPAPVPALSTPAFAQATAPPVPAAAEPSREELPEQAPSHAKRPMAAKKPSRAPSMGAILGIIAAMVVLGVGIFLGARFFLNRPSTPTGRGIPGPAIKPPGLKLPPANKLPQPGQPTQPTEPVPPSNPVSPEEEAKTLTTDQVLAKAREASAAKDFKKAILLYQEVLSRDAVNPSALQGIEGAKAAQLKQDQENIQNEKFIKNYQSALASFQEQDYASCLGVAWRLIYPDDTLARQLGKRDAIARLIRNGYYNWAIQDLKSANTREAESKLKDLLDFDRSDAEAQKLYQFVKKYRTQDADETYHQAVKNLTYRNFSESP